MAAQLPDLRYAVACRVLGELARVAESDLHNQIRQKNMSITMIDEGRKVISDQFGCGPTPLLLLKKGSLHGGVHFVLLFATGTAASTSLAFASATSTDAPPAVYFCQRYKHKC